MICDFTGLTYTGCPAGCPDPIHQQLHVVPDAVEVPRPAVHRIADLERVAGHRLPQYRLQPRWAMCTPHLERCDDSHSRPPGAQLCHACQDALQRLLGDVPAIVHELRTAARKDVSFVAHGTPPASVDADGEAIDESPLPWNESARIAELHIAKALPLGHGGPVTTSLWCLANLADIDQATVLERLSWALRHAHRVIDRPMDVSYVGRCPLCASHLYAERDRTVHCWAPLGEDIVCQYAATWEAHLASTVQASEDRLLTVSELVVALDLTRDQVKNLTRRMDGHTLSRPHLRGHDIVTRQVTTYRLGDVQQEATRRGYRASG